MLEGDSESRRAHGLGHLGDGFPARIPNASAWTARRGIGGEDGLTRGVSRRIPYLPPITLELPRMSRTAKTSTDRGPDRKCQEGGRQLRYMGALRWSICCTTAKVGRIFACWFGNNGRYTVEFGFGI